MKKILCIILIALLLCLSGCENSKTLKKWAVDYIAENLPDNEEFLWADDIREKTIDETYKFYIDVATMIKDTNQIHYSTYYVIIEVNISKWERGFRNFFGSREYYEKNDIKILHLEKLWGKEK